MAPKMALKATPQASDSNKTFDSSSMFLESKNPQNAVFSAKTIPSPTKSIELRVKGRNDTKNYRRHEFFKTLSITERIYGAFEILGLSVIKTRLRKIRRNLKRKEVYKESFDPSRCA